MHFKFIGIPKGGGSLEEPMWVACHEVRWLDDETCKSRAPTSPSQMEGRFFNTRTCVHRNNPVAHFRKAELHGLRLEECDPMLAPTFPVP